MNVIPETEIKAAFEGLKSDVAALRGQMTADREATGLAIDKRADDLQKALDAVDDFQKRVAELDRKVQTNAFVGTFGQSSGELKDALESFQAGFSGFNGEGAATKFAAGSKPAIKHLIEGVFMASDDDSDVQFHAPRHAAIARLQKAADDVYVVDACLRAQMDANALNDYNQRGGAKTTKTFARFAHIAGQFQKAAAELIDRSTEVVNWIPTQFSANLYEKVKIGLPLVNLFPEVAMDAPTMVLPLDMNDHEATRRTEVTTSASNDPWTDLVHVNPGALASNKITLEAEKLRSRYWISMEASEDSIVQMLPFLNRKHQRNMGEALEDAILNGHTAGLDTGGTHFTKTNPPAATDARYCWDGLRRMAAQYTPTPSTRADMGNVKPTVVGLRGIRAAMGEFGVDPAMLAYILGTFGYVKLLDDSNILTFEKMGPQATIRTGVLGSVDGVDVLVSRRMPQNANASGVIDGTTTNRTLATVVHREGCILGNRRRITLAQQAHISSDSIELVAYWRGDFQPVYPVATSPFVGTLYNIAGA